MRKIVQHYTRFSDQDSNGSPSSRWGQLIRGWSWGLAAGGAVNLPFGSGRAVLGSVNQFGNFRNYSDLTLVLGFGVDWLRKLLHLEALFVDSMLSCAQRGI
ncbi:uncharacterized protein N7479_008528 [Penicillium vulpinum]|uniref:uncharacterized protein n=1 Tax=Penicillium vulpinum TaxID=29845 RepID=UPI0025481BDF|nr:uncharacterized protein N7479_008528 [Penicillium vulpinum]KAJ5961378.1 hypothetical protein N7479_008528 [Penicillium vulpinum]